MPKSADIEKLKELLKKRLSYEGYFVVPWGVHADGISFPSLRKVAEDFATNNRLKLARTADFDIEYLSAAIRLEDRARYHGKILQLNNGLVILMHQFKNHGPENLEPTCEGSPIESYASKYILSGRLGKRNVQLVANIIYSRPYEQKERTRAFPPHARYYEWAPKGEFNRNVYREDREKLWFLIKQ